MTLKDYIINTLDQKLIFSRYFGISIEDIRTSVTNNEKIRNPFRTDKNASLSFRYYGQKLIARDFGDNNFSGDIFEVVGHIINKNCKDGKQFVDICNHIIDTCNDNDKVITFGKREQKEVIKKHTILEYHSRRPNRYNYLFYEQFGIDKKTFDKNIEVVDSYYINGHISNYYYNGTDPCYVYNINPDSIKLYFPFRLKGENRFISNNKVPIENIDKIKESEFTILIKSIKDKLLFDRIINEKGIKHIQVLSVSSESVALTKTINNYLLKHTKSGIIYNVFDTDSTGINNMFKLKETFNHEPIYFTLDYKVKDPTDMVKKYGYETVFNHFDIIFKNIL